MIFHRLQTHMTIPLIINYSMGIRHNMSESLKIIGLTGV